MEMDECGETLQAALFDAGYLGNEPYDCTHPEHWAAVVDDGTGWLDWDDLPAQCRSIQASNYCLLRAGHDGEHRFDWPSAGLAREAASASR